ncbi:MAG: inverse autotransporter beta domain-containing protein [Alphaproteobacteria bacterium]|nr:inverse autotransporter beta domain-containing protein [Alphaproteobacteria bacterium]
MPNCSEYNGRVDIEGRLGSTRDIVETSVFMPVACSANILLFSDLRLKGDGRDNREGNVALGLRQLHTSGIAGGYVYFDRRKSGDTDKYHSQITAGAEWLAEDWEVRGNIYVPTTGKKEASTGPAAGSAISDPFLQGTGIFVRAAGAQILEERPMHGFDFEGGLKLPGSDFWLHSGVFAFDAQDAPSLKGGRLRARYDINEHVSLVAEGQYDDQRGRQGWLGVRLSMPFGGSEKKAGGLKARMTASPVRDVDIVTSGTVIRQSEDRDVAVLNATTGTTQRVFYVDNTAAPGGDGSLDLPFNTLAAASAAANSAGDVIYIASGDGTSTGQDQGITLNQTGQSLIGEGADFIYDGSRFTSSVGTSFSGSVLRPAGTAPVLSNINLNGDGITIAASDIAVSGVTVDSAARYGIYAPSSGGAQRSGLRVSDVTVNGNGNSGLRIVVSGVGSLWDDVSITRVTATSNAWEGVLVAAESSGQIGSVEFQDITSTSNEQGVVVYVNDGQIGSIEFQDIITTGNAWEGVLVAAESSGQMGNIEFQDITSTSNAQGVVVLVNDGQMSSIELQGITTTGNAWEGVVIQAGDGQMSSVELQDITTTGNGATGVYIGAESSGQIGSVELQGITTTGNGGEGVYINASSNSSLSALLEQVIVTDNAGFGAYVSASSNSALSASLEEVTASGNGSHGLFIDDETDGLFAVDLGGGIFGSAGYNRIFGNTGTDLRVDLDGLELKAENNWWGNAAGLLPARVTLDAGSTVDTNPWLTSDPQP